MPSLDDASDAVILLQGIEKTFCVKIGASLSRDLCLLAEMEEKSVGTAALTRRFVLGSSQSASISLFGNEGSGRASRFCFSDAADVAGCVGMGAPRCTSDVEKLNSIGERAGC